MSGMTLRDIVGQKQQDALHERSYSLLPNTKRFPKSKALSATMKRTCLLPHLEPSTFLKGVLSVIEDQEEQWPWLFDGSSDDDDDDARQRPPRTLPLCFRRIMRVSPKTRAKVMLRT